MNGRLKSFLVQSTVVAVVLVIGLLIQRYAPWHGDFWTWANRGLPRFGGPLALAALVVLIVFLFYLFSTPYSPWHRPRFDDALARGCFQFTFWFVACVFVLLILAIALKIHWAIRLLAGTTLGLAAISAAWLIVDAIEAKTKKRR
jgi:hypothetical protein